jgi:cell division transport system ATP-binding protein
MNATALPMIRFQSVSKRYPNGREALSNLTLDVVSGEMVFLTGHSGAGKSTLLKLLALIERPTRGSLLVNGQNLAKITSRKIPAYRRQLGMVFQDHKLLADRSIFDNVSLPLVVANTASRDIAKRVRAALDQVGLLKYEQARPVELSTGEQQRVGLARAVVTKPPLLIADEPTGNLDPDLSLEVMNIFRRFQEVGVTVLIASHNVQLIERFKARRIHLEGGRLLDATDSVAVGAAPVVSADPLFNPSRLLDQGAR